MGEGFNPTKHLEAMRHFTAGEASEEDLTLAEAGAEAVEKKKAEDEKARQSTPANLGAIKPAEQRAPRTPKARKEIPKSGGTWHDTHDNY